MNPYTSLYTYPTLLDLNISDSSSTTLEELLVFSRVSTLFCR